MPLPDAVVPVCLSGQRPHDPASSHRAASSRGRSSRADTPSGNAYRGVLITQGARGLTYQTFTSQNDRCRYVLRAGADASLEVLQGDHPVRRTELLAWTYAPPPA